MHPHEVLELSLAAIISSWGGKAIFVRARGWLNGKGHHNHPLNREDLRVAFTDAIKPMVDLQEKVLHSTDDMASELHDFITREDERRRVELEQRLERFKGKA